MRIGWAEESFWARFGFRAGGWTRRLAESRFPTISFVVLAVIFLFVATLTAGAYLRYRLPSDSVLRRNVIGSWTHEGRGVSSFAADGSFSAAWTNTHSKPTKAWTYEGKWGITNGACTITVLKTGAWNDTNSQPPGSTEIWKIIHLDKTELVWDLNGQRVSLRRKN